MKVKGDKRKEKKRKRNEKKGKENHAISGVKDLGY